MKTYEMLFNRTLMTQYVEGRISGIIYVLSGMPEDSGYTIAKDGLDATIEFDATEDQAKAVADCVNKLYPDIYVGMREAE